MLRSDNGSEFLNHTLQTQLSSLGIIHQKSCTYTPQQNGVVERKHKSLLNTARALRLQASLPLHFWGDCILTATYLLNRTPTHLLHGLTPYEILFQKPPSYSHLKVFGSLCYATNVTPHKDKFEDRAHKCIFLGYPFAQKAYKLLNLKTRKVFISRDVLFVENVFPFKDLVIPNSPLFSAQSDFLDEPLVDLVVPHVTDHEYSHSSNTSPSGTEIASPSGISNTSDHITSTEPISSQPLVSTRPFRTKVVPAKFHDYTGLPQHIQSVNAVITQFSSSYQAFSANVASVPEPTSYYAVCKHPVWCEAVRRTSCS